MMLEDVHALVKSFQIAGSIYMGKMDGKNQQTIGIYNSKRQHPKRMTLGGPLFASYGTKFVTFLVHWNESPRDTEKAANELQKALEQVNNVVINKKHIQFIQLLVDSPVDIGTDAAGVYEMVIEAAVIYKRGE